MSKLITLKFAGKCKDCGAELEVGSQARWYGRGRVYGMDCHDSDDAGIRWVAGRGAVQSNGRCEDAPCCGCCGPNQEGAVLIYG